MRFRALYELLSFYRLLRTGGFGAVHRWVADSGSSIAHKGVAVDDIVEVVGQALALAPVRANCLARATVTTRMLRHHGIDATLVIGARRKPFAAHAWVEVNGQVVGEIDQDCGVFDVLDRLEPKRVGAR